MNKEQWQGWFKWSLGFTYRDLPLWFKYYSFRRHTNVSLLGAIIYDVLKVVVLLRKFIQKNSF